MGVLGKVKRAQFNKRKKETKRQLNEVAKVIDGMQKSCITCRAEFDNRNPEHLDNWRVNVYENKAELYCDKCYTPTVIQENTDEPGTTPKTV